MFTKNEIKKMMILDRHFSYGPMDNVAQECVSLIVNVTNIFKKLAPQLRKKTTAIVIDYGGIGDAIHTRLIAQHLVSHGHVVTWITNPFVATLYKDDTLMQVLPGFAMRFRDPRSKWQNLLTTQIKKIASTIFRHKKIIDVSCGVAHIFGKAHWGNYANMFFNGAGIRRDVKLKHQLTHNGKLEDIRPELVDKKYVIIEHASLTFGTVNVSKYADFVDNHKKNGVACVYLGSLKDPEIPNAIDCRGLNMYDTYTVLKNSIGMLARASGNQSAMAFLPKVRVYEVDIPSGANMQVCGYHENIVSVKQDDLGSLKMW